MFSFDGLTLELFKFLSSVSSFLLFIDTNFAVLYEKTLQMFQFAMLIEM